MALALLAASGNLQANPKPTLPPQPKTGTLIIYRVRMYPLCLRTYSFAIDGGSRYHLKNGRYMQFELPAGDHVLARPFDITMSLHAGTEKVHINPGQTTYFQYVHYPMMGMEFEVCEDQVEAKETASHCAHQQAANPGSAFGQEIYCYKIVKNGPSLVGAPRWSS